MLHLQRCRREQNAPARERCPSKAELRLQKDLEEMVASRYHAGETLTRISFPRGRRDERKLVFNCEISPREGPYSGGCFRFHFSVPSGYPFEPPRVLCTTRIFHPNVDWRTGEVALELIQRQWKPVLSVNTVVFGLQLLLIEPDLDHALNHECAALARRSARAFRAAVATTMRGGTFFGAAWPCVLGGAGSVSARKRSAGEAEGADAEDEAGEEAEAEAEEEGGKAVDLSPKRLCARAVFQGAGLRRLRRRAAGPSGDAHGAADECASAFAAPCAFGDPDERGKRKLLWCLDEPPTDASRDAVSQHICRDLLRSHDERRARHAGGGSSVAALNGGASDAPGSPSLFRQQLLRSAFADSAWSSHVSAMSAHGLVRPPPPQADAESPVSHSSSPTAAVEGDALSLFWADAPSPPPPPPPPPAPSASWGAAASMLRDSDGDLLMALPKSRA